MLGTDQSRSPPFYHPVRLAEGTVAMLDVMSNGRITLGRRDRLQARRVRASTGVDLEETWRALRGAAWPS